MNKGRLFFKVSWCGLGGAEPDSPSTNPDRFTGPSVNVFRHCLHWFVNCNESDAFSQLPSLILVEPSLFGSALPKSDALPLLSNECFSLRCSRTPDLEERPYPQYTRSDIPPEPIDLLIDRAPATTDRL